MRRPSAFKKTDVIRAAKAVLAAGLEIDRVEVGKDGSIVVMPGRPKENQSTSGEHNEWDERHASDCNSYTSFVIATARSAAISDDRVARPCRYRAYRVLPSFSPPTKLRSPVWLRHRSRSVPRGLSQGPCRHWSPIISAAPRVNVTI